LAGWADETAGAACFDFLNDRSAHRAGLAFPVADDNIFDEKPAFLPVQVNLVKCAPFVDAGLQSSVDGMQQPGNFFIRQSR
jgi:hypothetical protein